MSPGPVDRQRSTERFGNRDGRRCGWRFNRVIGAASDECRGGKNWNQERREVAHQRASLLGTGGGRKTILLGAGWSSKIHARRKPIAAMGANVPRPRSVSKGPSNESVCLRSGLQCGDCCRCSMRPGSRPPRRLPLEADTRAGACARTEASANAALAAPGQKPAPPAPAPVELKPRFQDGMKYAYVNVQAVAAASAEGKAAAEKIKGLQEQKSRELQEKNKTLQSAQQKLEQGGSVLSDQARAAADRNRASAA